MKLIILLYQVGVVPPDDLTSVNKLLTYILGVLMGFIIGFFIYHKTEMKRKNEELKEERSYIKGEYKDMIKLITEVSSFMGRLIITVDKNLDNDSNIMILLTSINDKLKSLNNNK